MGPGSSIDQGSHLLLIEHITASEVSFAIGDALLGLRVGEQLQGRLNGLEILRGGIERSSHSFGDHGRSWDAGQDP
ncbi:MAG: hypothetical protein WBV74_10785 [Pseudonocardiaceae bacterium]